MDHTSEPREPEDTASRVSALALSPTVTHMSVVLAVSTADPPFDKETTDLILRTSDHVEFHVWKGILAEASPVFEDMFVLQQPPSLQCGPTTDTTEEENSTSFSRPLVPNIDVPENSVTLQLLLLWIYPLPHLRPSRLRSCLPAVADLKSVLTSAHEYQMDGVIAEIVDILIEDCSKLGPL